MNDDNSKTKSPSDTHTEPSLRHSKAAFKRLYFAERFSIILIALGLLCAFIFLLVFLLKSSVLDYSEPIDTAKFGQFGDIVGGVVGSLWALAGVILFYRALAEQKKSVEKQAEALEQQRADVQNNTRILELQYQELELQRQESEATKEALQSQAQTMRMQRFESTFFSLLDAFLKRRHDVETRERAGSETPFFTFIRNLMTHELDRATNRQRASGEHRSDLDVSLLNSTRSNREEMVRNRFILSHEEVFGERSHKVKPYFSLLTHILLLISKQEQDMLRDQAEDASYRGIPAPGFKFYADIVFSDMYTGEKVGCFYHAMLPQNRKFRDLVLNYELLENLTDDDLYNLDEKFTNQYGIIQANIRKYGIRVKHLKSIDENAKS